MSPVRPALVDLRSRPDFEVRGLGPRDSDANLVVRVWSTKADGLWDLRADDANGKSLLGLDFGLPVHALAQPMRSCLARDGHDHDLVLDAVNRRGKAIKCRVTTTPKIEGGEVGGVTLIMEEAEDGKPCPPRPGTPGDDGG